MDEAIYRTRDARIKVLEVMDSRPRAAPARELSKYAPRIETIRINPDKIGLLIGPGGKNIKGIVAETGARSTSRTTAPCTSTRTTARALLRAKQIIDGMTEEIEVGKIYQGRVVTIKEFGAFVEVLPGKDGLVHICELADFRVNRTRGRRQESATHLGQVHRRRRQGPREA